MSSILTTPTCEKHNELKVLYNNKWKCKSCNREYQAKWFSDNRETQRSRVRKNNDEYILRNRKFVWDYKLTHPCVDCGETDPIVLDFDHRDPKDKSFTISQIMHNGGSLDKIKEEVAKCDVRCANCHRRRTFLQFGYFSGFDDGLGELDGLDW